MGASLNGVAPIATYTGSATAAAGIDKLIALIPDPDTTSTSGAQAGGGNLDEMSPIAAIHLLVELNALKAAIGTFNAP